MAQELDHPRLSDAEIVEIKGQINTLGLISSVGVSSAVLDLGKDVVARMR